MIQEPVAIELNRPVISRALPAPEPRRDPRPAVRVQSGSAGVLATHQRVRICRGNAVIGCWPFCEVMERVANQDLLPTDAFYDEDASEWFPLAELRLKPTAVETPKSFKRACYCGTGVPFHVCCGAGKNY